jgi:hypothetical protein
VKEMLIRYNQDLTYELNRIDRQTYFETYVESVNENAEKIRGYWEKK